MNLFSEALDELGRWYLAIPPFLIVSFLAALLLATGEGQARLQEAGNRLQKSAAREQTIDDLQNSLARSVAAERGFQLTGDQKYIQSYRQAVAEVEPRLEKLRTTYAAADASLASIRDLQVLVGKRLADLSMILAIQQKEGSAAAIALMKTSVGRDAGEAIGDILNQLRDREAVEAAEHGLQSRGPTLGL